MADLIPTESRWRSQLPHWEVRGAWHFVTIRCEGSLPRTPQERIREIRTTLNTIEPNSPEFEQLQRQYFLTAEKYLDTGCGFAPFVNPSLCRIAIQAIRKSTDEGWGFGDSVIMPNHIHLLMRKVSDSGLSLKQALERLKGRSSRQVNQAINRRGRLWQEDWFDRWMRDEAELKRTIQYIRNNPVKAHLCKDWKTYHGYLKGENPPTP
jgi:REP element-mobilizing transposase RayT